jgi:hypothetical protein
MRYVVEGWKWSDGDWVIWPGGNQPQELLLVDGRIPLSIKDNAGGETVFWARAFLDEGNRSEIFQVYRYPKPSSSELGNPDPATLRQMQRDMERDFEFFTRPPVDTDKFTGPVCRKPAPRIEPLRAPPHVQAGTGVAFDTQDGFNLDVYRKLGELIDAVNAMRQKA